MHMWSCQAVYNDIAATASDFFRPWQKTSRRKGRARGPTTLGLGPALGNFVASDENNLGFGAISLYIALQDPIYKLHNVLKFSRIFIANTRKISNLFSCGPKMMDN